MLKKKKIYLIRHGLTDMCKMPKSPSQNRDVYLSVEGVKQMERLSRFLKNDQHSIIYTSNFKRTIQASEIILNNQSNCQIQIDNRLSNKNELFNFKQNIIEFVNDLKKDESDYNILLVTHGRIIKLLYYYLKYNYFPDQIPKLDWCYYGSVTQFDIEFISKDKMNIYFYYCGKIIEQ